MEKNINSRECIGNIERSLIKRYRKDIWVNFIKVVKTHHMVEEGDKIAVAISGGKDSLLLAKLFQELKKHSKVKFDLEFIAMDPGYTEDVRENLEGLCEFLEIPVKIFDSDVFEVAGDLAGDNPCYMCARMRRGFLYNQAQELGCNKLALGHHFNDVIETVLLNVLCGASYNTMMPKLKSKNFENMQLIRPMYEVNEKDIIRWRNYAGIDALDCACTVTKREMGSKRAEIKELIETLSETFVNVDKSIFRSAQNVDLGAVLGWKDEDGYHSYLDEY